MQMIVGVEYYGSGSATGTLTEWREDRVVDGSSRLVESSVITVHGYSTSIK